MSGRSLCESTVKRTCGEIALLVIVESDLLPTQRNGWCLPVGFTKIIPMAVTGSPPGTNRYQGERTIANSKVRVGELYLWKVQEMLCCCGFVKSGKLSEKVVESRQRLGKSEGERS